MLSQSLHARFADSGDQRASDRRVLRLEAKVATTAGEGGIQIHNLSRTGMLVESDAVLPVDSELEFELPGGACYRAKVVWADEGLFGCRFATALPQAALSAALLRSAHPPQTAPVQTLSQEQAMARLREHWAFEEQTSPAGKKLPLAIRMWLIFGLGVAGWAVPAAAAWALL